MRQRYTVGRHKDEYAVFEYGKLHTVIGSRKDAFAFRRELQVAHGLRKAKRVRRGSKGPFGAF